MSFGFRPPSHPLKWPCRFLLTTQQGKVEGKKEWRKFCSANIFSCSVNKQRCSFIWAKSVLLCLCRSGDIFLANSKFTKNTVSVIPNSLKSKTKFAEWWRPEEGWYFIFKWLFVTLPTVVNSIKEITHNMVGWKKFLRQG